MFLALLPSSEPPGACGGSFLPLSTCKRLPHSSINCPQCIADRALPNTAGNDFSRSDTTPHCLSPIPRRAAAPDVVSPRGDFQRYKATHVSASVKVGKVPMTPSVCWREDYRMTRAASHPFARYPRFGVRNKSVNPPPLRASSPTRVRTDVIVLAWSPASLDAQPNIVSNSNVDERVTSWHDASSLRSLSSRRRARP